MGAFCNAATWSFGITCLWHWWRSKHPRRPNKFEWDEFTRQPMRYRRDADLCNRTPH